MALKVKISIFQNIPNIQTASSSLNTESTARFHNTANIPSMWESNILSGVKISSQVYLPVQKFSPHTPSFYWQEIYTYINVTLIQWM